MIKIYTYNRSSSSKNAINWLNNNHLEYEEINPKLHKLTRADIIEIILKCPNGINDILTDGNAHYREFKEKGIINDDTTMEELYEIICKYPKILKYPITMKDDIAFVGWNQEGIRVMLPKEYRQKNMKTIIGETYVPNGGMTYYRDKILPSTMKL